MKKLYYLILFLVCHIYAQNIPSGEIQIQGKVRHANTYKEIPNVNIYIKDTGFGTISKLDGTFTLAVPQSQEDLVIIFEHISFDTLQVHLSEAREQNNFYLQPRVIQVPEIMVQALKDRPDILKDLPQPYAVIAAKNFDVHGYIDAGDLLRTEQSIQIEEELSGKKTIALRAGNPDDVIVLYNGIRMNNAYDNIFDLSLINLDDVRHFEIIRGSNTSLYGPEAFSGVINVVPRIYKNYTIRFIQKFGTYAAGDWNLQLNHNFRDKLNISYSYKKGATKRKYSDGNETGHFLENKLSNHTANILYDLSDDNNPEKNVSLLYLRSKLDYKNNRYDETVSNFNQMFSLRYIGNIGPINNLSLTGAYQWFNNEHILRFESGMIDRHFLNQTFNLNVEKRFIFKRLDFLFAYQYENGELDFRDRRDNPGEEAVGIESALFSRDKHGLVSIVKFHVPTGSEFLKIADIDLSYRYDDIKNDQSNVVQRSPFSQGYRGYNPGQFKDDDWSESTLKFSTQLSGSHKYFRLNSYLNFGSNVKFPTLFQQISSPRTSGLNYDATMPSLSPEKNRSLEIGFDLIRETNELANLNGWQINLNYFQNYYENKFRMYYSPGIPIAFFDNVQNANIFGLESRVKLFLLQNKITLELGSSFYDISERAAFPFKSDTKYIMNFVVDHAGYSFQLHGFRESEQIGWVRNVQGEFWEVSLPGYSNFDIHLSKTFEFKRLKFFTNFSARNLLDDDTILEGIALRDRRFYISFGLQY